MLRLLVLGLLVLLLSKMIVGCFCLVRFLFDPFDIFPHHSNHLFFLSEDAFHFLDVAVHFVDLGFVLSQSLCFAVVGHDVDFFADEMHLSVDEYFVVIAVLSKI